MLESLRISGLALLEDCELALPAGLTVVSGETGAGKTVLLTSLRLLMGGRAEPSMVAANASRTEVDAVALVPQFMADELEDAGYAVEEQTAAFSRTVAREGRSRAAVSGRPVPAKVLADTLGQLVTIHGQADQWRLKGARAQRQLLDAFAGEKHSGLLGQYGELWAEVARLREHYRALTENHDQLAIELQYLRETVAQVDELELEEGEEEALDAAIDRLTNVQELREEAGAALAFFTDEGDGPDDAFGRIAEALRRAQRQDPSLEPLEQRASELAVEAGALASDLRDYVESLFDDPDELARLHERRARLTDLMRGRATDVAELMQWAGEAHGRIAELEGASSDPQAALAALKEAEARLGKAAAALTKSRRTAGERLSKQVDAELAELALANARFTVDIEVQELGPSGGDRVTMMLQPHPSAPTTPIAQGASGGEMSRIMLALEVVLASSDSGKTFVFDEIDAGIGGTTAGSVARRLRDLARAQQVIVVTHQPQIAVMADANFVVTKQEGMARVRQVTGTARTDEIVRMLGGDSEAARKHALELEARAATRSGGSS